MEEDDELYDVFIRVPIAGLHSPINQHSFRTVQMMLPGSCIMCGENVYPFSGGTVCLRCGNPAHRRCIHSKKNRCSKFFCLTFDNSSNNKGVSSSFVFSLPSPVWHNAVLSDNSQGIQPPLTAASSVSPSSTSTSSDMSEGNQHQQNVEEHRFFLSGLDPKPTLGSNDCVWRATLLNVAARHRQQQQQQHQQQRTFPTLSDFKGILLEKCILYILVDGASFPGQLCVRMHAMYLELGLPEDVLYLAHARVCLDSIASAVLSVLPPEIAADEDVLSNIINYVDRYCLVISNDAMYKKCFSAAQRITRLEDDSIRRLIGRGGGAGNLDGDGCGTDKLSSSHVTTIASSLFVNADADAVAVVDSLPLLQFAPPATAKDKLVSKYLCRFAELKSAADKLQQIIKVLQLLITPTEIEENVNDGDHFQREGISRVDTDLLLQRFSAALCAESLIRGTCWHAEGLYLQMLLRKSDSLLGLEGYALATLQQALRSLI